MTPTTGTTTEESVAPTTSRIPTFATIEAEAEFWDTHDTTEFEDEFEDAPDVRFVPAYVKNSVNVQFDEATLAERAERAFAQEIGVSTLIRRWVAERLQSSPPNS